MGKLYDVIIIGSGFGGIAAAVNLQKADMNNYLILERDEEMGGTWWCNTYPGAQVDVQSHLYSFSFESYDWSRLFAMQHEILKYTNYVIDKYGLRQDCKTNSKVTSLNYNEADATWTVTVNRIEKYTSKFIINASGGLSQPNIPEFKDANKFRGKTMHTGRWDQSYDYKGKKVAVIGSAASAIQVIPAIAPYVEQLSIFQRSAHYIMPREDRALTSLERQTFKRFPFIQQAYRDAIYARLESRVLGFQYFSKVLDFFSREAIKNIRDHVHDPHLQQKLIPNYKMGCKRILLSSDYYPTLNRDNVNLLTKTSGIEKFTDKGIQTTDGQHIDADLIVYATGFHASEGMVVYPIVGKNDVTIEDYWSDHAHAYLGTTVPNFPNLFLLAGPNTGTGHTSAIGMLESQLKYIMLMLKDQKNKQWKSIEIKEEVESKYNKKIQDMLKDTVWQNGGCHSWYQTQKGVNVSIYPTFSYLFRRDCKNFQSEKHIIQ